MNIAHIIPYSVHFPLIEPNGRYDFVESLAQSQAKMGHTVTIYGNPNSFVKGCATTGISEFSTSKDENNVKTLELAFATSHDVYHSHFDSLHYRIASRTTRPIVFTQHWWPSQETINLSHTSPSNVWAVPPTLHMHKFDIQNKIQSNGHIYHGIDLELFREHTQKKNGRLLFVGRISPEKNLDIAIQIAQLTGVGLDIVGKIHDKNLPYWKALETHIDGTFIRYMDTKSKLELPALYSAAHAVIFPSDISEAFGLVAVEAQACGTPIIMNAGGSREELVRNGITGFLCHNENDFITAVMQASTLKPADCRTWASNFSHKKMTLKYDTLYEKLLSQSAS